MTGTTAMVVELRRLQVGARLALAAGIAASLAANVAAAEPTMTGRVVAGWSPVALFVTVELITRLPARAGALALGRLTATGTVAAIAAWISYHHIVAVALAAGESPTSARLLPFSVDGMILAASLTLVDISRRLGPHDGQGDDDTTGDDTIGSTAPGTDLNEPTPVDEPVHNGSQVPARWLITHDTSN